MPYRPDFTILFPETCKIIGLSATKQQKRPKAGLFCLSKYLLKLSRIIFSGQASDSTIHTDQGKQPDRQKQQLPFKIIRNKIRKESDRRLQNARSRINTAFFQLQNKTTPHWFMVKLSCRETINHAPERSRYIYDNIPPDVFGRCF
jgi:hypothetical protein